MAKTWTTRPSQLYKIKDELAAFSLDRAVATFGEALTAELEAAEGKSPEMTKRKRVQILERWIPETPGEPGGGEPTQFRSPRKREDV